MNLSHEEGPNVESTTSGTKVTRSDGSSYTNPWSYTSGYQYRRALGQTTPDFYKRKKKGELLPMTSWYQFESEWSGTGSQNFLEISSGDTHSWVNGYYYTDPVVAPRNVTESECLAEIAQCDMNYFVQKAAAKIAKRGFDALTFVAEFNEAVSMFRNIGFRLRSLPNIKEAPNAYLEGRYGWRTLVYDVQELADLIDSWGDSDLTRLRESAGSTTTREDIHVGSWSWTYGNYQLTTSTTFTVGCRGSVIGDIRVPKIQIDVLTTAWEITTLSFVVDWFINVGQALDALRFSYLASSYVAAGGVSVTANRSASLTQFTASSNYSGTTTMSGSGKSVLTQRVPMSVPHNPMYYLRLDEFKTLDLVALIMQRFKFIRT